MTDQELATIEKLANAATDGPWAYYSYGEKCYAYGVITALDNNNASISGRVEQEQFCSDENPHDIG